MGCRRYSHACPCLCSLMSNKYAILPATNRGQAGKLENSRGHPSSLATESWISSGGALSKRIIAVFCSVKWLVYMLVYY